TQPPTGRSGGPPHVTCASSHSPTLDSSICPRHLYRRPSPWASFAGPVITAFLWHRQVRPANSSRRAALDWRLLASWVQAHVLPCRFPKGPFYLLSVAGLYPRQSNRHIARPNEALALHQIRTCPLT